MYWAIFAAVVVFALKYYTSIEMRKLERRLNRVKEDLHLAKEKLQQAQDKYNSVETEETSMEGRVGRMKEIIEDIQMRMTGKDDGPDEEILVADSPSRSF